MRIDHARERYSFSAVANCNGVCIYAVYYYTKNFDSSLNKFARVYPPIITNAFLFINCLVRKQYFFAKKKLTKKFLAICVLH